MMALGQSRNMANKQANIIKLTGSYDGAYKLCSNILLSALERMKG